MLVKYRAKYIALACLYRVETAGGQRSGYVREQVITLTPAHRRRFINTRSIPRNKRIHALCECSCLGPALFEDRHSRLPPCFPLSCRSEKETRRISKGSRKRNIKYINLLVFIIQRENNYLTVTMRRYYFIAN